MPTKRKSTPKAAKVSATSVQTAPTNSPSSSTTLPEFLKRKEVLGLILGLVILASLYFLRGVFVAATVNGKPISRLALVKELEKQNGKETLNSLVTKELIFQEAAKQKVTVSDKDIDAEVKKIEESVAKQGQNLDELLKAQNLTRDSFRQQLKLEKTIQALIGKDVVVTDKEVEEYIANNKESFPTDAKVEDLKEPVKQQLTQQRMSEKFESWLADLQAKASIKYLINL